MCIIIWVAHQHFYQPHPTFQKKDNQIMLYESIISTRYNTTNCTNRISTEKKPLAL